MTCVTPPSSSSRITKVTAQIETTIGAFLSSVRFLGREMHDGHDFIFSIQLYLTYTRTVNIHKRQSATKRKLQLEADKKET